MEDYEVYDYMQDNVSAEPEAVYALNSELSLAAHIVNDTGANLFLTGKAGTGKTTFLCRPTVSRHHRRPSREGRIPREQISLFYRSRTDA